MDLDKIYTNFFQGDKGDSTLSTVTLDDKRYRDRLLEKSSVIGNRGCRCWKPSLVHGGGYGKITVLMSNGKKRQFLAHRLMFMLHYPTMDLDGLEISHLCNTCSCLNIEHLSLETHETNCGRKCCFFRGKCFHHGNYPDCLI